MEVRGMAAGSGAVLDLRDEPTEKVDALKAIFDGLKALDTEELRRLGVFARHMRDRGPEEVVFYAAVPDDVNIAEAILPGPMFKDAWRGRPSTLAAGSVVLRGALAEPLFVEPAADESDAAELWQQSCVVITEGHVAEKTYRRPWKYIKPTVRAEPELGPQRPKLGELHRRNEERKRVMRERLIADSVPVSEAARRIGRHEQTAINRANTGQMVAFQDGNRWMFPVWQFDHGQNDCVVDGLREVLAALNVAPFSAALWLGRPNGVLEDRSPIDALRAGEVERVVSLAKSVGTQ